MGYDSGYKYVGIDDVLSTGFQTTKCLLTYTLLWLIGLRMRIRLYPSAATSSVALSVNVKRQLQARLRISRECWVCHV